MEESYFYIQETKVPIYVGNLVFIITNDAEKLKRKLGKWDTNWVYAHAVHKSWKGRYGYIVILNFDYEVPLTFGTVAHEALHATLDILNIAGVVVDYDNQEPVTYLHGWITDQLHKFIEKKGFTKKLMNVK